MYKQKVMKGLKYIILEILKQEYIKSNSGLTRSEIFNISKIKSIGSVSRTLNILYGEGHIKPLAGSKWMYVRDIIEKESIRRKYDNSSPDTEAIYQKAMKNFDKIFEDF